VDTVIALIKVAILCYPIWEEQVSECLSLHYSSPLHYENCPLGAVTVKFQLKQMLCGSSIREKIEGWSKQTRVLICAHETALGSSMAAQKGLKEYPPLAQATNCAPTQNPKSGYEKWFPAFSGEREDALCG